MRILFLITIGLLLTSLSNAQSGCEFVHPEKARYFISIKGFNPGSNNAKMEMPKAFIYFSQQDFFGFKKQEDTIFYKPDTSGGYRKTGYVIRRELRTIPGEALKKHSFKCDSAGIAPQFY